MRSAPQRLMTDHLQEASPDDSPDPLGKAETLLKRVFHSTCVVAPVAVTHACRVEDREIDIAVEAEAAERHSAVPGDAVDQIDTLVDGKTGDETVLVVDMRAEGTHTIRAENMVQRGVRGPEI